MCADSRHCSGIPGSSPALYLALSGFRDVEKWRGRATASLGGKTDQQWLHPCLVFKLTAPAPSTLIPSEPVNRFLRAPLTMAAPLFLLQMEAPEMAPAWWLRWLGGSTSLLRTFRAPRRNPCCSPVGGSDVSVCSLHFTKPRNHTCCVVQESELTFEPRTSVACVLPSSHCIFFALSGLGDLRHPWHSPSVSRGRLEMLFHVSRGSL